MSVYQNIPRANADVLCDLRSDTVTRPCEGMRKAMAEAEVGDDVWGDDPTVLSLQARMAEMMGKEAALFMPSGTQSNLCALLAHCGRGEAAIVGAPYHIYHDEANGASVLGGIALHPIPVGTDMAPSPQAVADQIQPDDPHYAVSRLLCLENTVSGQAIELETLRAVAAPARAAGLSVHLDGARFFNAITALGCQPHELAGIMDSVSICLSKGLGCPIGSVLVGSTEVIARAARARKMLGGGMRQIGVLAAAGHYALDNIAPGLDQDHQRAIALAEALRATGLGEVRQATNMVFFTPKPEIRDALYAHMNAQRVLIGRGETARFVLHRDVDDAALSAAIQGFQSFQA